MTDRRVFSGAGFPIVGVGAAATPEPAWVVVPSVAFGPQTLAVGADRGDVFWQDLSSIFWITALFALGVVGIVA